MWEDQQNATYNLVDFTASPAGFTTVGIPANIVPGHISDAYSLDEGNNLYNFMGFEGQNINWISLDMSSGAVVYSNPATDNVFGWAQIYDQCNPPTPIIDSVVAGFIGSSLLIAAGECIDFTDLSTGAPTSWQWSFSGGTPATSTDQNPQNICYNTPGCHDVTLIVSNATTTDTLTIPCYIDVLLGVAESSTEHVLSIYPHPATDQITFELANGAKPQLLQLFALDGKLVQEITFTGNLVQIDRSALPAGLYMYTLQLDDGTVAHGEITFK
jgi:hypothetical protein